MNVLNGERTIPRLPWKGALAKVFTPLWLPLLTLILIAVITRSINVLYFPPLTEVIGNLFSTWLGSKLFSDVIPSLIRMAAGLAIAIVIGIGLGLVMGMGARFRRMTSPIIEFIRGLPAPTLLPFAMVLFGIGDSMKIFLIALVCVFPILLNTIDAVLSMNPTLRMTCSAYSIGKFDRVIRVMLPGAMPQIFAGIRTAFALALIMVVFSEMLSSTDGIGHLILIAQRNYDMATMWGGIMLLGILGYVLSILFALTEKYVLSWHRRSKESRLANV